MTESHKPSNVISLIDARMLHRPKQCEHYPLIVDEALGEVECGDCGEKLNPIAALARMARQESKLGRMQQELKTLRAELEHRNRCKCTHCGHITKIIK